MASPTAPVQPTDATQTKAWHTKHYAQLKKRYKEATLRTQVLRRPQAVSSLYVLSRSGSILIFLKTLPHRRHNLLNVTLLKELSLKT